MSDCRQDDKRNSAPCPVNSSNEWDPLEEVIVGRIEGAVLPGNDIAVRATMPAGITRALPWVAGRRYPRPFARIAQRELDGFIHVLESEGIRVRRPDIVDFSERFRTPNWSSRGFCAACPRDGILVLGNEIIETPMAWRCRHFEMRAYRSLFEEYRERGATWTIAPRPLLLDSLYDREYTVPGEGEPIRYVINESETVFDAADFARCGRDLFVARSNVTNRSGIDWLRGHVGNRFRIHEIESRCRQPMHIDSSFMPLAPGKLLVNPDYIDASRLPDILGKWDVLSAPRPDDLKHNVFFRIFQMTSRWISLNVLMLDEKRVVVEASQHSMIKALTDFGLKPIPVPFLHFAFYGGSFHCAALDVRRTGVLKSYF